MSDSTQPAPDRRVRTRAVRSACSANRCRQGQAPCPCPQACELPGRDRANTTDPLHDEPATPMEAAGLVLGVLAVVIVVALVVHACASA